MTFRETMQAFAEKLGGKLDLTPDDSGVVTLSVDERPLMLVDMEEIASVVLCAPVATPPPEENLDRLYRAILAGNDGGSKGDAVSLSLNPETGEIYICRALPLDGLGADGLLEAVEGFVRAMDEWRARIVDFRGGGEGPDDSAAGLARRMDGMLRV